MAESRVAIVTGGGGDIAGAIARQIAPNVDIVALVDRDAERLAAAEAALADVPATITTSVVDVRSREQIRACVDAIEQTGGSIEVLVNVAGCPALYASVVDTTDEAFDDIVESHLRGTVTFCQAVVPGMMRRACGRIVNTTSVAAFQGPPGRATYAAAKAGIVAFTRSLAAEVGRHGVTANCISPGFTASRRVVANFDEAGRQEHLAELGVLVHPRRMVDTAEVAAAAAYLCSPAAAYVTGTVMHVNGGAFRP